MKFIHEKWFSLTVGVGIGLIIGNILFICGFYITYASELEFNWEAISAVADWSGVVVSAIGVIASFVAIWYAIQVPKKIAYRQDKIALFEKRYECFQTFEKCHIVYKEIEKQDYTIEGLRNMSRYIFGIPSWKDVTEDIVIEKILQYEYMIHQMQFLFPGIEEKDAYQLYVNFQRFLNSIFDGENIDENANDYFSSMDLFIHKYEKLLFDALNI